MRRETSTGTGHGDNSMVFIELEKLFRRKGHTAEEATKLAYEAMDVLESWYEERLEEKDG